MSSSMLDDVEQVVAALVDDVGIFAVRRADSSPTTPLVIISEKPTMALSGVRSSWPMVARKRDLAFEASSASAAGLAHLGLDARGAR